LARGNRTRLVGWLEQVDLSPELRRVQNTVILWPEYEEVIDPVTYERLTKEFPNIPVREVPGSHNDMALAPRKLVGIVRKELDD